MKKCQYCHTENEDGTLFCTSCGARFEETPAPAPVESFDGVFVQPPESTVKRMSGFAIASLALGAAGVVLGTNVIIGALAIVFACIAFHRIKSGKEKGKGLAVAGLILGIAGVVFGILVLATVFSGIFEGVFDELDGAFPDISSGALPGKIGKM